jgi:hypothetical protein
LIVPADGGAKKRLEESNNSISNNIVSSNNKKGDSKGSGRAESGASSKEGTSMASGPNATGLKSKQDGEGCKRLVLHSLNGSQWFDWQPDTGRVCNPQFH